MNQQVFQGPIPKINGHGGIRPNTGPIKEWMRVKLGARRVDDLRLYAWRRGVKAETIIFDLMVKWFSASSVQEEIRIARDLRELERSKLAPRPRSNPRRKR